MVGLFQVLILLRKMLVSSVLFRCSLLVFRFLMFIIGIMLLMVDGNWFRLVWVSFLLFSGLLEELKLMVLVLIWVMLLFELMDWQLILVLVVVLQFVDYLDISGKMKEVLVLEILVVSLLSVVGVVVGVLVVGVVVWFLVFGLQVERFSVMVRVRVVKLVVCSFMCYFVVGWGLVFLVMLL